MIFNAKILRAIFQLKKMAELLKSDLKLDKNEILRIRKTGGSKNSSTIKIQTVADIVVAERFGEHVEFQRQFGEIKWTCSIRGGNKGSRLRFLNVPEGVENNLLIQRIESFAKPLSEIKEEVFGSKHGSWLINADLNFSKGSNTRFHFCGTETNSNSSS